MNYAITKPEGGIFNDSDIRNVTKYITSITAAPILNDFPVDIWDLINYNWSFDDADIRLHRNTPDSDKATNRRTWIRAFMAGDQVVLLALIMARCHYIKGLKLNEWHKAECYVANDEVVAQLKTTINGDFMAFVMRGGINNQTKVVELPPHKREAFKIRRHGFLYKLESIDLVAYSMVSKGYWGRLTGSKMLSYLTPPSLKKASLSIVEIGQEMELLELPLRFGLSRNLRHLILDYSYANTNTLLQIIKHTSKLKSFF